LDLPLEAKDWWTFIFPGGFLTLQLILLYDLIGLTARTYKLPLEAYDLLQSVGSLNTTQVTLFAFSFLFLSIFVGFALELLSYKIFEPESRNGLPIWISNIIKKQSLPEHARLKLLNQCNRLWGVPEQTQDRKAEITPAIVWALLYNLWSQGSDHLVDDLDKTITAWTFCRSMSVAAWFGVISVIWTFLHGLPTIGIISLLGVILGVVFFRDQRKTVREAYFRKILMYSVTLIDERGQRQR